MVVPASVFAAWINSGGDMNDVNEHGNSLLYHACLLQYAFGGRASPSGRAGPCADLLIEHGARFAPDYLHLALRAAAQEQTRTAPGAALDRIKRHDVEWFLEHGADASHADANGWSVLHVVANCLPLQKAVSFIPSIIAYGGKVDAKSTKTTMNMYRESNSTEGVTPLHLAAQRVSIENALSEAETAARLRAVGPEAGSIDVVRRLLRHGADVNAKTTMGGTPAGYARSQLRQFEMDCDGDPTV